MQLLSCRFCGSTSVNIVDYINHDNVHLRPHTRAKFFTWWLGEYLNEYISRFEYVIGLDEISIMDEILYISPEMLNGYLELYQQYLKGTCKENPCWECIRNNSIRTMPERRYMKWKIEKEGVYSPDRKRITPRSINIGDFE